MCARTSPDGFAPRLCIETPEKGYPSQTPVPRRPRKCWRNPRTGVTQNRLCFDGRILRRGTDFPLRPISSLRHHLIRGSPQLVPVSQTCVGTAERTRSGTRENGSHRSSKWPEAQSLRVEVGKCEEWNSLPSWRWTVVWVSTSEKEGSGVVPSLRLDSGVSTSLLCPGRKTVLTWTSYYTHVRLTQEV